MTAPELPEEAVQAVAQILYRDYDGEYGAEHLSWRDFAEQARKLLAAADPILRADERRKVAEEQRGAGLVVVSAEDLYHVVEIAENYLDMCEPPPADELGRVARLRAALPEETTDA